MPNNPYLKAAIRVRYPHEEFEAFLAERLPGADQWVIEEARSAFYTDYSRPKNSPASLPELTRLMRLAGEFSRRLYARAVALFAKQESS